MGVFVADPAGKIIQINTGPGVFGDLAYWPSSDWLGISAFGDGGSTWCGTGVTPSP